MTVAIKELTQHDDRTLRIVWWDGEDNLYDVVSLRRQCPCALCNERKKPNSTGKPPVSQLLDDVDDSVRPVEIKSVGRYGLLIVFSDGHRTGIYSLETLRKLQKND